MTDSKRHLSPAEQKTFTRALLASVNLGASAAKLAERLQRENAVLREILESTAKERDALQRENAMLREVLEAIADLDGNDWRGPSIAARALKDADEAREGE